MSVSWPGWARITPALTATLSNWMEDASDTPDTLVLAVSQEDLAQAEDAAFTWDFNGTVCKKLAASGIDDLVLQVGDQVTALSDGGLCGRGALHHVPRPGAEQRGL